MVAKHKGRAFAIVNLSRGSHIFFNSLPPTHAQGNLPPRGPIEICHPAEILLELGCPKKSG
jgi:hypothetical protein